MAIINTPEELKPFLPTPYNNSLKSMPNFDLAEEEYLIPIIGQELYTSLQGSSLSVNLQKLLIKCRAVIAPFGYLHHLEFLQVQMSDNGLIAVEATNQRKAYKWEYNNIKDALSNMGFSRQESLIGFLQETKTDFPQWASSPYNNADFAFIRNGKELGGSIAITQPHRSYMSLKPLLFEIGELTIQSALGEAYYQDLSSRILSGNIVADEQPILRSLRMASARYTMAKAAKVMNVRFSSGSGFTIADSVKDTPDEGRKNASNEELEVLIRDMELSAAAFLDKVKKTLNEKASATLFPIYYASDKYTNPHVSANKLRTDRKGMFTT